MKFIGKDGYQVVLQDNLNTITKDISPIREILERKDFSNFSFSSDTDIALSETMPILVNILEVGAAYYFFKKDDFNKDDFVEKVSKLKDMPMNSFYDALNKVKALDEVASNFNPLFVIYNPIGKLRIYEDCYKTLELKNKTIYVSQSECSVTVVKSVIKEKKAEEKPEKKKEEKDTKESQTKPGFLNKIKFLNPIPIIKKDKFHFLFALIATFLIGFTLSIGIYNAYAGKLICIFFFICSLAGSFLNFMIYKDAIKEYPLKSSFMLVTAISSVIGMGISIGGYYIFKATSKEALAVGPHIMMILGIILLVYLLSCSIPAVYFYLKKRKK